MTSIDNITEQAEAIETLRDEIGSIKNSLNELLYSIQETDQKVEMLDYDQSSVKSSLNDLINEFNRVNKNNINAIISDLSSIRSDMTVLADSIDRANHNIAKLANAIDDIAKYAHSHGRY